MTNRSRSDQPACTPGMSRSLLALLLIALFATLGFGALAATGWLNISRTFTVICLVAAAVFVVCIPFGVRAHQRAEQYQQDHPYLD